MLRPLVGAFKEHVFERIKQILESELLVAERLAKKT